MKPSPKRSQQGVAPGTRQVARLLLGTAAVLAAVHAVSLLLRPDSSYVPLLDEWVANAVFVLVGVACALRALRVPGERLVWIGYGLAMAAWTGGALHYRLNVQHLDPTPFPTPADALWLLYHVFVLAGVVLLIRARAGRLPAHSWMDAIIAGAGLAAIASWIALSSTMQRLGDDSLAVGISVGYVSVSVLVVGLLTGASALRGWRAESSWWWLIAGIGLIAVTEVQYAQLATLGTYAPGGVLDAGWRVGAVLVGIAAWLPPGRTINQPAAARVTIAVPVLFSLLCAGLLAIGGWGTLGPLPVVLAVTAVLAALIRTTLAVRYMELAAVNSAEARTDDLTGLGNRRLLYETLREDLVPNAPHATALLLIDLDRFKHVNESLGHHVGDRALVVVAERMRASIKATDVAVRWGGDEFALVLRGLPLDEAMTTAVRVAERIDDRLAEPMHLEGTSLRARASVGIAVAPDHTTDARELLQRADLALYRAKEAGGGTWRTFDPLIDHHDPGGLLLVEELQDAMEHDELILHYQPKFSVVTGQRVGVEALVRWNHPRRGLLFPDSFVPLAEEAGLMGPLTRLVLNAALAQLRDWRESGYVLDIAVNLSVSNLLDTDFPSTVQRLLSRHRLPAEALQLEITESTPHGRPCDRAVGARGIAKHRRARVDRRLRHGLLLARVPA